MRLSFFFDLPEIKQKQRHGLAPPGAVFIITLVNTLYFLEASHFALQGFGNLLVMLGFLLNMRDCIH